jgi:nucleoside triphosphatase
MIFKHPPADFHLIAEVSSCFIEVEDKILYLKYQTDKYHGAWGVPAGKVESGESPAAAISRELVEETSIKLPASEFKNPIKVYVRYPEFDFVFYMYKHRLQTAPTVTVDKQEHQTYKWVTHEQALHLDLITDGAACIHAVYPFDPTYWTNHLKEQATQASSFKELGKTALAVLNVMPHPIGQVCGPLSNGGKSSMANIKINTDRFHSTVKALIDSGYNIFDQIPFQEYCLKIAGPTWTAEHNQQLLDDFYIPIFESGLVSTFYFMPNWQSSAGATWEHDTLTKLGANIVYLEPDYSIPKAQHKRPERSG